jgi:DNA-binding GntR family transcriptional regulator
MSQYLSLKDHVYNYISEKINDGSLKPEDNINEQQISDALEISRTPIREALIQLAAEGYLESIPRKGFRVRNLDYNKAKELYEIIGLLDGRIAYLTIDIISEEDIRNMEFLADSMTAAIEQDLSNRYYELQVDFHNTYINLCKNQEMINLLNQLKRSFLRKYYVFGHSQEEIEILKETNQEHYEIIRLFKEKKKEELERYIRDVHWSKEKAIYDSL